MIKIRIMGSTAFIYIFIYCLAKATGLVPGQGQVEVEGLSIGWITFISELRFHYSSMTNYKQQM